MKMIEYSNYVLPMVAVAVYIICAIIKPLLKDQARFLPLIAAAVGVVLAFWMNGDVKFSTFVAGLVSGFGATGIDQAVSIPFKKDTGNDSVSSD